MSERNSAALTMPNSKPEQTYSRESARQHRKNTLLTTRNTEQMEYIKTAWNWLTSANTANRPKKTAIQKLQMGVRVTAKCRYNASERLQRQGRFAFFTNIFLSVALILIPLLQNSNAALSFSGPILNMMQIFFAVCVLIYSIVIGTARHELRAENLTECGDKLKELSRDIDKAQMNDMEVTQEQFDFFNERYSLIISDTENHTRGDYELARLEMIHEYHVSGLPRFRIWIKARLDTLAPFALPIAMNFLVLVFITDTLAVTEIISPYLRPAVSINR